jgi:hypothetical protein
MAEALPPVPQAGVAGEHAWRPLLWATVADVIREAASDAADDGVRPPGGVDDYVTTLEVLTRCAARHDDEPQRSGDQRTQTAGAHGGRVPVPRSPYLVRARP